MEYDAFVYYSHIDQPLGCRVSDLLTKNGLICWDDKKHPCGLSRVAEVLPSCKSFIIVGDIGISTYESLLFEEMLLTRNQQPIFFICAKRCHDAGVKELIRLSNEGVITKAPVFSYEDENYLRERKARVHFTDQDSFEEEQIAIAKRSVQRFDTDQFEDYIRQTILKEIQKVVLFESPRVFISHSHSDNAIAENIYEILIRNGIKCWIDTKDIPAGASYPEAIIQGLDWCNCLVLVYSKSAIASENILNELEVVHRDHKKIIPYLIDDSPISGGYRFYLPRKQWIDARLHQPSALRELAMELFRNVPERGKDRALV